MNKKLALILLTILFTIFLTINVQAAYCCPGSTNCYDDYLCCCAGTGHYGPPCGTNEFGCKWHCSGCESAAYAPKGAITSVTCNEVVGWACDRDNYGQALYVTLIIHGISGERQQASMIDPATSGECGGTTNHGFNFIVPVQYRDAGPHSLEVFIEGAGGGGDRKVEKGAIQGCGPSCTCYDPDGHDYSLNAEVIQKCTLAGNPLPDRVEQDTCIGEQVQEFFCVGDNIESEIVSCPIYGCEGGICRPEPTCVCNENDGGNVNRSFGVTFQQCTTMSITYSSMASDICIGSQLQEMYCVDNDIATQQYDCTWGCEGGACLAKTQCECSEGDLGLDIYSPATTRLDCWTGSTSMSIQSPDECLNSTTLKESYCVDGNFGQNISSAEVYCEFECENNACRTEPRCEDSDLGRTHFEKGTTSKGALSRTDYCTKCGPDPANPISCAVVQEFYCANDQIAQEPFECQGDVEVYCLDGRCVSFCLGLGETCNPNGPEQCCYGQKCTSAGFCTTYSVQCTDTDEGLNTLTFGRVTVETTYGGSVIPVYHDDVCTNCDTYGCWSVVEWYCRQNLAENQTQNCLYNCLNGECHCPPTMFKEICQADAEISWANECTYLDRLCCDQQSCRDPNQELCIPASSYTAISSWTPDWVNDEIAFCSGGGVWLDCDSAQFMCDGADDCSGLITGCQGDSCWIAAGEDAVGEYNDVGTPECCGDDVNEVYRGGSDGTFACCDDMSNAGLPLYGEECVMNGICLEVSNVGYEICGDMLDNDCDGQVEETPCPCTDRDGGRDEFTKGVLTGGNNNCPNGICEDTCSGDVAVQEWSCSGDVAVQETIPCQNNCVDGACNTESCDLLSCDSYCDDSTLYHSGSCSVQGNRASCSYEIFPCPYGCANAACIDVDSSQTACELNGFVWIDDTIKCCGDDQNEFVKDSWNSDAPGCCQAADQCLVHPQGNVAYNNDPSRWFSSPPPNQGPRCVNDGAYILDNLCIQGGWTSRTSYLTTQLLTEAQAYNPDDYVVFCGTYDEVLNYYNYVLPDSGNLVSIYLPNTACSYGGKMYSCFNNFCVLTTSDASYNLVGSTMNPGIELSDLYSFLDYGLGCSLNADGQFHKCSLFGFLGSKLWYNHKYEMFIYGEYNEGNINLGSVNFESAKQAMIVQPFQDLVFYLYPTPDGVVNRFIEDSRLYNSIYLSQVMGKGVKARKEGTYSDPDNSSDFIMVSYSSFETDLCQPINTVLYNSCAQDGATSYYVRARVAAGDINPLFNYWGSLTAGLRFP